MENAGRLSGHPALHQTDEGGSYFLKAAASRSGRIMPWRVSKRRVSLNAL